MASEQSLQLRGRRQKRRWAEHQHEKEPLPALPTLLWAWSKLSPLANAGNSACLEGVKVGGVEPATTTFHCFLPFLCVEGSLLLGP